MSDRTGDLKCESETFPDWTTLVEKRGPVHEKTHANIVLRTRLGWFEIYPAWAGRVDAKNCRYFNCSNSNGNSRQIAGAPERALLAMALVPLSTRTGRKGGRPQKEAGPGAQTEAEEPR